MFINNIQALLFLIIFATAFVLMICWLIRESTKKECKVLGHKLEKNLDELRVDLKDRLESVKRHCIKTVNDNAKDISTLVDIAVKEHINDKNN